MAPPASSAALLPVSHPSPAAMSAAAPLIPDLPSRRAGAATRLGVTVAVLAMAAAGAAAWFSHLIPHP
jgi:hypothetical protein